MCPWSILNSWSLRFKPLDFKKFWEFFGCNPVTSTYWVSGNQALQLLIIACLGFNSFKILGVYGSNPLT